MTIVTVSVANIERQPGFIRVYRRLSAAKICPRSLLWFAIACKAILEKCSDEPEIRVSRGLGRPGLASQGKICCRRKRDCTNWEY